MWSGSVVSRSQPTPDSRLIEVRFVLRWTGEPGASAMGRPHRPGGRIAVAGPRRRFPRHRLVSRSRIEHDLVHRQLELADHREEGVYGRLRLAGLDLRDQARRYTEPPRQLAQPDVLLLARCPEAMAEVVAQALPIARRSDRSSRPWTAALLTCQYRVLDVHPLCSVGCLPCLFNRRQPVSRYHVDRAPPTSRLDEPRVVRVVVARRRRGAHDPWLRRYDRVARYAAMPARRSSSR